MNSSPETAEIIPFTEPAVREPVCSFCKQKKSQVKKMVVGLNNAAICDQCIKQATKRLNSNFEKPL